MVLSLLRAGDHHIDVPAPVLRAPQPVAPIGNRRLYTVPPRGEVRLGLMPAILAPDDKPHTGRCGVWSVIGGPVSDLST